MALCCLYVFAWPPISDAQVNPFLRGTGLHGDDMALMRATASRLYQQDVVADGASDHWSNPKTGDSGTVTVLQSFEKSGMACRKVRYDIRVRTRAGQRSYTVNWCKTASGEWKVA
jgi:surface antigen